MKKITFLKLQKQNLQDKIFLIPTDTIYGFSALYSSRMAIEKIKIIKKRNQKKGFVILINSYSDLKKFGIEISIEQKKIIQKIWPGRVSIVFKPRTNKFKYISGDFDTLVFRIPKYRKLRNFIKKVGPIISTSANLSGEENILEPNQLNKEMKKEIDFFIDVGKLKSKPSNIIQFLR